MKLKIVNFDRFLVTFCSLITSTEKKHEQTKIDIYSCTGALQYYLNGAEYHDFYIACAMGLHRTDIALCTYWAFYAANKGVAPPPIRGYRREDGHDTNKIMRVLNAFYRYKAEHDGQEPMPMEVFKGRKKVINELSKMEKI